MVPRLHARLNPRGGVVICGIAGSWHAPDFDVEAALRRIGHRGPDAMHVLNVTGTGVVHGHVRLAIMDLDMRSDQPFVYGDTVLSYVGETWNYAQLREELEAHGSSFQTTGDTEVVAAMLDRFGTDALTLLDWQGAMAWTRHGETFLARDRFGEVPLYVREEGESLFGGGTTWASERRALDGESWAMPPGTFYSAGGGLTSYYDPPSRPVTWALGSQIVLRLVDEAVSKRLMADVPVAFLCSGGLDSSLILSLVRGRTKNVVAYVAALEGRESEDLRAAIDVCDFLGVELRQVILPDPIDADIERCVDSIEIPMQTQVEISYPCLELARRISADGFKVVLSGEGADELFGGYGNLMRHAGSDRAWVDARAAAVAKQARGNFVRTNKTFMRHGVEARLPFVDRALVEAVLPLGVAACPPGKALLKDAARGRVPDSVIDRDKATFQGASGVSAATIGRYGQSRIGHYNEVARAQLGALPIG